MKIKSLVIAMSLVAASGAAWAGDYNSEQAGAMVAMDNSTYQSTIDSMNQVGDRFNTGLGSDWTRYVSFHGGLFTDFAIGNNPQGWVGENDERVSVTNGYLAIQATPNEWAKVDMTVNYSGASATYGNPSTQELFVDQAFATFGNADRYPVFVQAGKQYSPFGRYDLFPITKSLGQVLTETNQTEAQVGFVVPKGLYGSVYAFQNGVQEDQANGNKPYTLGGLLGFKKANDRMSFDLGMGYMSNMSGVQAIEDYVTNSGAYSSGSAQGYTDGTDHPAIAPYVSFKTGPFGIDVDYVTALEKFNKNTLPFDNASADGAEPSAVDAQVTYDFNMRDMDQQVFVGYQRSNEASALDIPEKRVTAGYNVTPWQNVELGLQVNRNSEYSNGYAGNQSNDESFYTVDMRVGVQF